MTTKFHVLTDEALTALVRDRPVAAHASDLLVHYCELRDHHIAETEVLTRRDRSAILRMAGNIAAGLFADPEFVRARGLGVETAEDIAAKAVRIARAIVAEVDRCRPMTTNVATTTVDVAKLRTLLHGFSQAQHADVAAAFNDVGFDVDARREIRRRRDEALHDLQDAAVNALSSLLDVFKAACRFADAGSTGDALDELTSLVEIVNAVREESTDP